MRLAAILLVSLVPGCATERPACSPEALGVLESQYVAEAVRACRGRSADECAELPAIREKYRVKREAWRDCK